MGPDGGPGTPRLTLLRGLVRTARPRQWVKNVLVVTAPLAAGELGHARVLTKVLLAFLAFCLAAAAVYFVNDVIDVESDRAHPRKRNRPIAAGIVPVNAAWTAAVVCGLAALGVAAAANGATIVVIACYLVIHIGYCVALKHVLVVDLMLVSAGFLLRAMAGGVAANIPLSQWFLLTAGFGSLLMVAGKRYSEMVLMGEDAALSRRSLAHYSKSYLGFVWQIAAGLTIMTYSLWAFTIEQTQPPHHIHWTEISVIPWCFVMLRYAMFIDQGKAGEPEDVVLGDRVIMAVGACWLLVFAMGVFHVGS
jgi:decaprenyl-phosphate phosphoribosyltransferase